MSSDASAVIARHLEQDSNVVRIKKLLLYACKDWWESDSTRLSVISLESLVREARQLYPTLDHLRSRLTHLVGTLNKSADYHLIAQLIIVELSALYIPASFPPEPSVGDTTAILRSLPAVVPVPSPLHAIAQHMEQDANLNRIKKLLICVCRRYWEANPYVIEQIPVLELLEELMNTYCSRRAMSVGLTNAVKTISKPMEYSLIAETILHAVEALFPTETAAVSEPIAELALTATAAQPIETAAQPIETPLKADSTNVADSASFVSSSPAFDGPIDLFNVRLDILKATNPLHAKILLFSLAHYPFEFRSQDWANLKLHSLDGLLRTLLGQGDSIEEMQANLQAIAQQFVDASPYQSATEAIVKALKPNYNALQRQIQRSMQSGSMADVTCAIATQLLTASLDPD